MGYQAQPSVEYMVFLVILTLAMSTSLGRRDCDRITTKPERLSLQPTLLPVKTPHLMRGG